MRRLILSVLIVAIALPVLWLFTARWCVTQIDRFTTVPEARLPAEHIGWNGAQLQIGDAVDNTDRPLWNADLTQRVHVLDPGPGATLASDNSERLIVTDAGRVFVLGIRAGTMPGSDGSVPAYRPEPGDKVSIAIEHSARGWPHWFEFDLTGHPTRWKRWLYYRLTWEKASGQRLTMVWRYEQAWRLRDHDIWDWTWPYQTDDTGPARLDIRPAR